MGDRNTTLVKFQIMFNVKHKGLCKATLLDERKAYDTILRAKFRGRIGDKLDNTDIILLLLAIDD